MNHIGGHQCAEHGHAEGTSGLPYGIESAGSDTRSGRTIAATSKRTGTCRPPTPGYFARLHITDTTEGSIYNTNKVECVYDPEHHKIKFVSVLACGGNSVVSARRAECPMTWSSARA